MHAIGFGLLGVIAAAAIGIARWQATTYRVDDRALHFRSGVFSPDETVVPLERIQAVDTIAGPIQRLFGVTGLHVQTPGGGEDGDVVLSALSSRAAADLRAALGHADQHVATVRRRLSLPALLVTALTAPQLGIVLPVVGGIFGALQNGLLGAGETEVKNINSTHEVVIVADRVAARGVDAVVPGRRRRLLGLRGPARRGPAADPPWAVAAPGRQRPGRADRRRPDRGEPAAAPAAASSPCGWRSRASAGVRPRRARSSR